MGASNMIHLANEKPSKYLEEILFRTQSNNAEQVFEKLSNQLFESSNGGSFVEVCVQVRNNSDSSKGMRFYAWLNKDDSEMSDIDFSCRGIPPESHSLPEAINVIVDTESPRVTSQYMGENGIVLYTACEPMELGDIARMSEDAFRICFVRQRHTNSRLLMSRELFETLMSSFEIFPRFRDFVMSFGSRQIDAGAGPPQLRFRVITTTSHHSQGLKSAGYECAYELRCVELNPHHVKNPWRLRQTAVYQQHKYGNKSSSWVVVSASSDTESSIDQYIKSAGDLSSQCPFELHLLILDKALSNWHHYTAYLAEIISKQSHRVLAKFSQGSDLRRTEAVQELQRLKDTEDELIEVNLVLESLHDTVESLSDNYAECVVSSGQTYTGDHDIVHRAFQTQLKDINFTRKNMQSLHTKLQGTRTLLSSLQALQNCAFLGQNDQEKQKIATLPPRMAREGVPGSLALNVLTLSVLLYLPIVIACLFFSTQFVGMESNADGKNLTIASNAWWLLVISAPLIIISLAAWYIWSRLSKHRRERRRICQVMRPMSKV